MGASMSLKLNSSGGGSVTLQEPSTASNLTVTLPTTTGTAVIQNASNNLLMNSGYGSDAVAYGCRAWVNFNGTGTPSIRASANVTSLTDNGTGDYTVNLTTAMPDANYAVVTGGKQDDTYNDRFFSTKVVNTSSFRMYFAAYSIGLYDPTYAHAAIFR
jgi:hypothetical protein